MARHREFDENKVLDALKDVFWERGFEGTSYSDIMSATGLQKGSLYAAFGDKRSLYQHAIARYDTQEVSAGVALLNNESLSPKERLTSFMNGPVEAVGTRQGRLGCLLCNAAIDQAPSSKAVAQNIQSSMNRLNQALMNLLGNKEAADYLLSTYFGARVLVKAGMDKKTLENVRDRAIKSLDLG